MNVPHTEAAMCWDGLRPEELGSATFSRASAVRVAANGNHQLVICCGYELSHLSMLTRLSSQPRKSPAVLMRGYNG